MTRKSPPDPGRNMDVILQRLEHADSVLSALKSSGDTAERLAGHVKWFIALGVTVIVALIAFELTLHYRATEPVTAQDLKSSEDALKRTLADQFRLESARYDPIFRKVLLNDAYGRISSVHISELRPGSQQLRDLREIQSSLNSVRAFDGRNSGLNKMINMLLSFEKEDNKRDVAAFLALDPITDSSLDMTPEESAFIFSLQGLLYLHAIREAKNKTEYWGLVKSAEDKLLIAKRMNVGISNMWNGLGVCLLEETHETGDLSLISEARRYFRIAYEINASPLNLAAGINNLAYANMLVTLYTTSSVERDPNFGETRVLTREKARLDESVNAVKEQLEEFLRALTYDPTSISVMLSIAECYCTLAMYKKALGEFKTSDDIFNEAGQLQAEAMAIIRQAKARGFSDWTYLFSRVWVDQTLLRNEAYRKELLSYINR